MKKLINELKMYLSMRILMYSFDLMPKCEFKKQFAYFLYFNLSKKIDDDL